MPQPRKYKNNAERQAAYRARKARAESAAPPPTTGAEHVVARVMAADKRAS